MHKRAGSIICNCGPDAGAETGMPRDAIFGSGDLGQRAGRTAGVAAAPKAVSRSLGGDRGPR